MQKQVFYIVVITHTAMNVGRFRLLGRYEAHHACIEVVMRLLYGCYMVVMSLLYKIFS